MIAQNVIIADPDFHQALLPDQRLYSDTTNFDGVVKIGCNIWIGMKSLILKGYEIRDNTIITAGSIVIGQIPANCIAAGNPATQVNYFISQ